MKLSEFCAGIQNYEGIIYYVSDCTVSKLISKAQNQLPPRNPLKTNLSLTNFRLSYKVLPITSCLLFQKTMTVLFLNAAEIGDHSN